jgi:hypothetical protein
MREIEIVCASLAPLFDHVVLGSRPGVLALFSEPLNKLN